MCLILTCAVWKPFLSVFGLSGSDLHYGAAGLQAETEVDVSAIGDTAA